MFGKNRNDDVRASRRWTSVLLWVLAFLIMAGSAVYQRKTGPTYPLRGEFTVAVSTRAYKLIRSSDSDATSPGAEVVIPDPGEGYRAELHWRRYRATDDFTVLAMERRLEDENATLVGLLPAQPPAGKLEYFISVNGPDLDLIFPEPTVVIRFKGDVPSKVLLPHVLMMVMAILVGMRAALAALVAPGNLRGLTWLTLLALTAGGMILGPIVQKYAFGAYWTGWPLGGDWTDNKTLVMWLAWVLAAGFLGWGRSRPKLIRRLAVLIAALVMMSVYLIPHSMGGSELDYSALEQGMDPGDAIGTGRR